MNKEKLLELATQCDYAITGYIHSGSKIEYEIWGGSMETHKLNKFAELIVHRVISVYNDSETFKTSHYDDNRVLEYFGIKE
jgi:hypothetical protein